MKLSCEIVQDLLPLYEDHICSGESRRAVEEHLRECETCRKLVQHMQNFSEQEIQVSQKVENNAVVKSFRKIRRRWSVSLIAMLLLVPIIFLSVNQMRMQGICYTNMDDIFVSRKYVEALEAGDFEKATKMMDFESRYYDIQFALDENKEENIRQFLKIRIDGEEWMVERSYFEIQIEETELELVFWEREIFNNRNCMVPMHIWNKLVENNPEGFLKVDEYTFLTEEEDKYENPYMAVETAWGTYMMRQFSEVKECQTAMEFCMVADVIPMNIYEEGIAEWKAAAEEEYNSKVEYYKEVADMTLEEYCAFMKDRKCQELTACKEQGYEFSNIGYKSCYYDARAEKECWVITYGFEIDYQGQKDTFSIDVDVRHGDVVGVSIKGDEKMEMVERALSMYYMP